MGDGNATVCAFDPDQFGDGAIGEGVVIDVLKKYTKAETLEKLQGAWKSATAEYKAAAERTFADEHRRDVAIEEFKHCVVKAPRGGMVIHPARNFFWRLALFGVGGNLHLDDLIGVGGRLAPFQHADELHAVGDLAPDGVLAVEERGVVENDEKLAVGAVRILGAGHGADAALVADIVELGLEVGLFRSARAVAARTAHEMCRKCFHKVEFEDSAKMTDTILALRGRD